jgi:Hydrazine synthase alpha subunit middle domain
MLLSSVRLSFYSYTALCVISCGYIGLPSEVASNLQPGTQTTTGSAVTFSAVQDSSVITPAAVSASASTQSAETATSSPSTSTAASTAAKSLEATTTPAVQPAPANLVSGGVKNPILFVAQVPTTSYFAGRMSTFGNHQATANVQRGGDLYIRYPDGALRNLTKEAGYGSEGLQGANAIAVREPSVHWSGTKAVFSMVVGAPAQYQIAPYYWQIYEISGLGKSESVSIKLISTQPKNFNNVSPIYGTDDRIIFTSDRPRNGDRALYPQLDEYESTPTNTGIWSLNASTGDLRILSHSISGAFSPTIDSFGRVVYTRWDHLQRDQQADADRGRAARQFGSFDYSDETAFARKLTLGSELFPESRSLTNTPYGPVNGFNYNLFSPWQINEDGTDEEALNHVGRQEYSFGFLPRSFINDPSLKDSYSNLFGVNRRAIKGDGGLFHLREDPSTPGRYYGIYAEEFGTMTADQIVSFNASPSVNPEDFQLTDVTYPNLRQPEGVIGGRFRNPLPLTSGTLIASHTPVALPIAADMKEFRLREVVSAGRRFAEAGAYLTSGISKSLKYYSPDTLVTYDGPLWEIEPVEVVARQRPTMRNAPALETPESSIFRAEQVNENDFRNWLKANELALIVTRNQTSRDRADVSQPINLAVSNGVVTKSSAGVGPTYNISHYQIFQADQTRGYEGKEGRRAIATPLHDPKAKNMENLSGPAGSVKIAADGSTAALVPARRALTWQTTDAAGEAIVRERVWITFQPGEVRVCASCHGVNKKDQAGNPPPVNPPEALRTLLKYWKTIAP